jgi:hypothetical protein
MGVLTKPDLVIERATQQAVIDLINKGRKDLSLGYYVLKNRNADDQESTTLQRHEQETASRAGNGVLPSGSVVLNVEDCQ